MYRTLNISNPLHSSPPQNRIGSLPNTAVSFRNSKNTTIICAVSVESLVSTSRGSLYEVLRLEPTATIREIKTAYRSLAKVYHPDLSNGDEDFMEIHNAYATLADPAARAVYDLSLVCRTKRRKSSSVGCSGRSGFYPTRRWETDQCW